MQSRDTLIMVYPRRIRRWERLFRREKKGGSFANVLFGKIVRASYSDMLGGVYEFDVITETGVYHSIVSRRALRRARHSSALIVIA